MATHQLAFDAKSFIQCSGGTMIFFYLCFAYFEQCLPLLQKQYPREYNINWFIIIFFKKNWHPSFFRTEPCPIWPFPVQRNGSIWSLLFQRNGNFWPLPFQRNGNFCPLRLLLQEVQENQRSAAVRKLAKSRNLHRLTNIYDMRILPNSRTLILLQYLSGKDTQTCTTFHDFLINNSIKYF